MKYNVKKMKKLLIWAAVINGLVAPVILVLIVLIASKEKIMRELVNGKTTKVIGWFATAFMIITGIITIISLFLG